MEINYYPKREETAYFINAKNSIIKIAEKLIKLGYGIAGYNGTSQIKTSPVSNSLYIEIYNIGYTDDNYFEYQIRFSNHYANQLSKNNVLDMPISNNGIFVFTRSLQKEMTDNIKTIKI